MAFVVETGTGLTDATAYVNVATFRTYWEDRCIDLPIGSDQSEIQGAIVQASSFLDRRYRDRIIGLRLLVTQSLEFPRTNAFYRDGRSVIGVASEWREATNELAFRVLEVQPFGKDPLAPDPVYDETNRVVTSKREKVGPLEESTGFSSGDTTIITWRKFPTIVGLVRELVREGRILQRA